MPKIIDLSSYGTNVYLAGDIHGQPESMAGNIRKMDARNAAIIILGDVGLGFSGNHCGCIPFLNRVGKDRNNHFYLIRGNHDNPESWTDEVIAEVKKKYEKSPKRSVTNVHWLNDFDTVIVNGKKLLVLGGAVSIDRKYAVTKIIMGVYFNFPRPEGKSWWKNETLPYDGIEKIDSEYYGILAHTGPTPPSLERSKMIETIKEKYDPEIVDDVNRERQAIDTVIEKAKPRYWFNGHYHVQYTSIHAQGDRWFKYNGVEVANLGIDEIQKLDHYDF